MRTKVFPETGETPVTSQTDTAGFYISEAIAGAAFLVWCAAIVMLCAGLS